VLITRSLATTKKACT